MALTCSNISSKSRACFLFQNAVAQQTDDDTQSTPRIQSDSFGLVSIWPLYFLYISKHIPNSLFASPVETLRHVNNTVNCVCTCGRNIVYTLFGANNAYSIQLYIYQNMNGWTFSCMGPCVVHSPATPWTPNFDPCTTFRVAQVRFPVGSVSGDIIARNAPPRATREKPSMVNPVKGQRLAPMYWPPPTLQLPSVSSS